MASYDILKKILANKRVSLKVRKRVLQFCIESVILYDCETLRFNKLFIMKLEAAEM